MSKRQLFALLSRVIWGLFDRRFASPDQSALQGEAVLRVSVSTIKTRSATVLPKVALSNDNIIDTVGRIGGHAGFCGHPVGAYHSSGLDAYQVSPDLSV